MMKKLKTIKKMMQALNYDLFRQSAVEQAPPFPEIKEVPLPQKIIAESTEPAILPTIEELYLLFEKINSNYFDNKLPMVRIEYSSRMTNAGSYTPALKLIKMSKKYHEIFPNDIEDTLKHEMIHIIHFYHDADFKREAKRIGTTLKAKPHPSLRRKAKYVYCCPGCKKEYPRQKRFRLASCGSCSKGGKYDDRFKLKLLKS